MNARRWTIGLALAAVVAAVVFWPVHRPGPARETQTLSASPRRIASLTLASDELLAELVPVERVVCVTHLADDREISNVPGFYPSQIPRLQNTSSERIIALGPELVCVASYNSADFLEVLARSGLPIYRNDFGRSMDEIESGIVDLGRRVGEPARAAQVVSRMRDRRGRLADRLRDVARPRVLFWSAGFTAGRATTIDDIIREGGGMNVAAENQLEGPAAISPEQVIAADPAYILLCQWSQDAREGRIDNHPLLRNLAAVREGRVIAIQGRFLTTVSQHVVEGAERLARQLHPDCFTDESTRQPSNEKGPS